MTDQNHALTFRRSLHCVFSGKIDLTGSRTRTSWKAVANFLGSLLSLCVKNWGEKVPEVISGNTENSLFLLNEALLNHIQRDVDGGKTRALSVTSLQHPQLAFLDSKLNILHITEVLFEFLTSYEKLFMRFRKIFGHLCDGLRGADTSNDVLALCINEILTVKHIFSSGRVTCECNAGPGTLPGVTKDHSLNVDGCSPSGRNSVLLAINNRAVVLPGVEDGRHGSLELLARIFGEVLA